MLRVGQAVVTKPSPSERFLELLGTTSKNFLGSGLTMSEFLQLHNTEKIAASWSLQSREEKRRRLDAVINLSVELARIREISIHATRLGELAIEAVIEGDRKTIEEFADTFSFADERDELRNMSAPLWATFRALLLQAHRAANNAAS